MRCHDKYYDDPDHTPRASALATHAGNEDKQILLGDSECNWLQAEWFGWGDNDSYKMAYLDQFPFRRHGGSCAYVLLDGSAHAMLVPTSDAVDSAKFRGDIYRQLQTCPVETFNWGLKGIAPHVCFWNRYEKGLQISEARW